FPSSLPPRPKQKKMNHHTQRASKRLLNAPKQTKQTNKCFFFVLFITTPYDSSTPRTNPNRLRDPYGPRRRRPRKETVPRRRRHIRPARAHMRRQLVVRTAVC